MLVLILESIDPLLALRDPRTLLVGTQALNLVWKRSFVSKMPQLLSRLRERERELVKWCFEPSQPLGIISGLRETFIKSYKVEMTNKAEMRPEEQSENGELSGELME